MDLANFQSGEAGDINLSNLTVVMACFYNDDEDGTPWRVMLFIDADADDRQFDALSSIFLGKYGGDVGFATNIADVLELRRATLALDHKKGQESIRVDEVASAAVIREVDFGGTVSCGIPGHDRPGQESVSNLAIAEGPFQWSYEARCGFATSFAHSG